jgi:hypothetical protein
MNYMHRERKETISVGQKIIVYSLLSLNAFNPQSSSAWNIIEEGEKTYA